MVWCISEDVCQFYNILHSNRVGHASMLRSLMFPVMYVWMLL